MRESLYTMTSQFSKPLTPYTPRPNQHSHKKNQSQDYQKKRIENISQGQILKRKVTPKISNTEISLEIENKSVNVNVR